MSNKDVLKSYSVNIDFLDYDKKRDVTKNIVYSEGDINTAFIYATLTMGGEIIDLTGLIVTVGIKNNEGEQLINGCEIVNAKEGKISIPFTSTSLSKVGFNKFEIVIYNSDKKLVSPQFVYRVADSVLDDGAIEDSNEYDILLVLISQVQGALENVGETTDRIENLEQTMIVNEEERKTNEMQRVSRENSRVADEAIRQTQEEQRQASFNTKISEIDALSGKLATDVNNKILEIDTRFDSKAKEISSQVNLSLDNKTTEKFKEVDTILAQKLTENDGKVNEKLTEASTAIQSVNSKIIEVETVKTQLTKDVNAKIVEVDTAKSDLTGTINNKMIEFENRFGELESANTAGELTQARTSIDGVVHESLSQRLQYDYEKKANKDSVYTKAEIDTKIDDITSVDDTVTSIESTWSSSKINSELTKKETVENVQNKVTQAVTESKKYADDRVANLVGQSPELLDTLEELSNALGNDPNFATTVMAEVGKKADKTNVYTKAEVDVIVGASTSIDDSSVSGLTTWSSNKINVELGGKVSKESGKGLSSNDYTTAEKEKLASLENYVHPNDINTQHVSVSQISLWTSKADGQHQHNYNDLLGLPTIPSIKGLASETYVNEKVAGVVNSAPETLDTLNELASALGNDPNFATTVANQIGTKADKTYVDTQLGTKANKAHTHEMGEILSVSASRVNGMLAEGNIPLIPKAKIKDLVVSSSVASTSETNIANSKAVKQAYDKGVEALNQVTEVKNDLKVSENTSYTTTDGVKEFNCKDGYVDNIHIEGSTLVNYSNSQLITMGGGATNSDKVITLPNGGYVSYLIGNSSTTGTKELSGKTLTVEYKAPIVVGEQQLRMCVAYLPTDSSSVVYLSTYAYVNKVTVTVPDVTYKRLAVYINNTKDEVISQEHKIICVEGDYSTKSLSYFDGIKSAGQGNTIEVVTQNADETRQDKRQITTTLRGIPSGMKDEIIKQSDKYCKIHKCKEITLSSTTGDWYMTGSELNNTLQFGVLLTDSFDRANVVCNRFIQSSNKAVGVGYEAISILNNSKAQPTLYVRIDKSKLSSPDVTGFKAWLDTNSIIVVYELLTPLVEELYNFNPRTFEGKTTLLLNSGVVQCDASFEVTNSLGSSLDVLFSIVSELQREVGSVKEGLIDTTNLLVDLL